MTDKAARTVRLEIRTYSMSVRVYRFGLLRPTVNGDKVREQMWLAHRYRNTLIEIERGRRDALRSLLLESDLRTRELTEIVEKSLVAKENAEKDLRSSRAKTRSRSESVDEKERVKSTRKTHSEAVKALREHRKSVRDSGVLVDGEAKINELANELKRSARKYCGVYWGTYLLAEAAADASHKELPLYDGAEPNNPKFLRRTPNGNVGVQLQGGLPAETIFGQDTQIRVAQVPEAAWYSTSRGERRRLSRTTLFMRIGSIKGKPVWAEWPMVMHRPLPENSVIKMATVSLRAVGPQEEWSVHINLDTTNVRPAESKAEGALAIDIGWRMIGNEIRVATWHDSFGKTGEFRLSQTLLDSLHKDEDLRSIRDKNFNVVRETLIQWKKVSAVPEWLGKTTSTLSQWRSIARLSAVVLKWKKARFENDQEIFDTLEKWRYNDYHLWKWEANQRSQSHRQRRDVYRNFAASLANTYETVILEKLDLKQFAVRKPVDEPAENETARSNRHLVSISDLRGAIENAYTGKSRKVDLEDPTDTTTTCFECKKINALVDPDVIMHTCEFCFAVWDRDENAAKNLLHRYRERLRAGENVGTARSTEIGNGDADLKETRWTKARRMAAERREQIGTARKPGSTYQE
jgi:transposase